MDERRELLEALLENAREDVPDLARQLGVDEERAAALLADLEESGVVRGYRAVVDWSRLEEEHVEAVVELNVELDRETSYADIARRLVQFPQVSSLRLVSGDYDFAVRVEAASMREVSGFVSEQIAPVPEVTQTVTHYVMETYKDRGVTFGGADDDDRLSVSP
jgi:DNA-binding Lrp family transcriptional regulator